MFAVRASTLGPDGLSMQVALRHNERQLAPPGGVIVPVVIRRILAFLGLGGGRAGSVPENRLLQRSSITSTAISRGWDSRAATPGGHDEARSEHSIEGE